MIVHKLATFVSVTNESLEDDAAMRAAMAETFRQAELARRGFVGRARCARCRRGLRCVEVVVPGRTSIWRDIPYTFPDRYYGRTCYQRTLEETT